MLHSTEILGSNLSYKCCNSTCELPGIGMPHHSHAGGRLVNLNPIRMAGRGVA